jgi:hypothetical protein
VKNISKNGKTNHWDWEMYYKLSIDLNPDSLSFPRLLRQRLPHFCSHRGMDGQTLAFQSNARPQQPVAYDRPTTNARAHGPALESSNEEGKRKKTRLKMERS